MSCYLRKSSIKQTLHLIRRMHLCDFLCQPFIISLLLLLLLLTMLLYRQVLVCVGQFYLWQVWCTTQRARYIAIVVSLLAAAITLPEFFDSRVILSAGPPNVTSSGTPRRVMTSMGKSQAYTVWYKYANQTLFTFLPLTLLVVFNYLLIAAVRTAARRRHLMSNGDQQLTGNSSRLERHLQGQQRITVRIIYMLISLINRPALGIATCLSLGSPETSAKHVSCRSRLNNTVNYRY